MRLLRYAVYVVPRDGPVAAFGARWLGWDARRGREMAHPALPEWPGDVGAVTDRPRRYGFHATIKPPFRLAAGGDAADLRRELRALCTAAAPLELPGLALTAMGRFLALVPPAPCPALDDLAARVVRDLDRFRAPTTAEERERRRPGLDAAARARLDQWGYAHVMEGFRFHLTLTGPLPRAEIAPLRAALQARIGPLIARPFTIADLCLVGEAADGRFHVLERVPLGRA